MNITDGMLRMLKKKVELDAGYNNITLRSGKRTGRGLKSEVDMSDGDIELLIENMAKEILKLRREIKRLS